MSKSGRGLSQIHQCTWYACCSSGFFCELINDVDTPITDDIEVKYKTVTFDGRFWNASIYRQPPSKEVDDT